MQNPYLEEFQSRYNGSYFFHELRDELVKKYAWAVPTEASIEAIAALGPIVEVGAGTGYWAWLLRQVGATVEAYDVAPGDNHWCKGLYTEVKVGGPEVVENHPGHSLLLCWPPYQDPMSEIAVRMYTGRTVIHVGEDRHGCTGNSGFHDLLEERFECPHESTIDIPTWAGIHDFVQVWRKVR